MGLDSNPYDGHHLAIRVKNLGKQYILYDRPSDRLKHSLFWRFGRSYGHPFWALRDVSFDIHKGETFGIIGRNGSGKSTLLQILASTLTQTTGELTLNGRVAALLELGSGFNPEFTGRENIRLNGMILGLSGAQIEEKFNEITAFADIGEYIDQPVKFYSSGMFVRLAFAVAAHVDADILLIDEALAVGDIFFRQKCYQRLENLRAKGVSIVLVSHAMNEVEQFCDRALLLSEGDPVFLGSAIEAVKRYYLLQQVSSSISTGSAATQVPAIQPDSSQPGTFSWPEANAFLDIASLPQVSKGAARCLGIAVTDANGQACLVFQQGQTAHFFYEFEVGEDIEVPIGGVEILNEKGIIVHGKHSLLYGSRSPSFVPGGGRVRFRQSITLEIFPGEYTFNVGFSTISRSDYAIKNELPYPDLAARITILNIVPNAGSFAVVHRTNAQTVPLLHLGIANLPGECQISTVMPEHQHTSSSNVI